MDQTATRVSYEFGDFCVDATQRLLRSRIDGEPIALTSKAFETLLYLVEHAGELIDKTTLMKAVWPNVVVEENNLNQSISALRRAFGETALEHRFIVTVPGRGYRFVAPVAGFAPAYITRDPLFRVPLVRNARYRALTERLEAQMRSTEL